MKRKFVRISAILLVLVGLPLIGWRAFLAIVINKELTDIRAAGLPTNGEELNRWYPAVPDDQNAALVLTQAFALLKTINTYSDKRAEEVWKLKDKFPKRADLLTAEQIALIRWHVETNTLALMKAREALKLPGSRYPVDCKLLMGTELPHLAHLVNLSYLNQCNAALAILDGQKETPADNIETIIVLARTLDDEPCVISQLVRLRMIRMAFATLQQRANAGTFNPAEIAHLKDSFTRIRATNTAAHGLIGDRAMTIPLLPDDEDRSTKNSSSKRSIRHQAGFAASLLWLRNPQTDRLLRTGFRLVPHRNEQSHRAAE